MSLRLERRILVVSPVRATVAMTVAMLALSPVAAEAQPVGERAPSVVVRPGDSLWSISQERIGPNASPRRIMKGAERIHALNRSRIGADPDLLLVGQVLSVPWSLSGPPNGSPNGRPAREASEESQAQESQAQESQAQESQGAKMLRADPKAKVNLPEPHGAVLAPSARLAALKGTQLGALPEILSETSAGDRRRLLGLGIWALTLVLAAVVVALGHGASRRRTGKLEFRFRETYGRPYGALGPFADPGGGLERTTEARERTASHAGPTSAIAEPAIYVDLTDPFILARARRARVRGQLPGSRTRVLWRPAKTTRVLRRPLSGRLGTTAPVVRKEWEPAAALVGILERMPLTPGTIPSGNRGRLRPHLEVALRALGRLERLRGLSETEKTRREALEVLMEATEKAE